MPEIPESPTPQKTDAVNPADEATSMELLPIAPHRSGRGLAILALMMSVVATSLAGTAITLVWREKPVETAEKIEHQRVIDRAVDRLDKEVALLQAEMRRDPAGPVVDPAVASIEARLNALVEDIARQKIQTDRIDRLNEDFQPLTASLGSIEQRLRQAETRLNQRSNASLTAMVVTSTSLQAALRAGEPFRAVLSALEKLAGDDGELRQLAAQLHPYADRGLPTSVMMATRLETLTGAALAALRDDPDKKADDFWSNMGRKLNRLVTLRRAVGEVEGDDPAARLARAQFHAAQQDLSRAIQSIDALPSSARQVLVSWRDLAQARVVAEQTTSQLIAVTSDRAAASNNISSETAP